MSRKSKSCSCGSGKKYRDCCYKAKGTPAQSSAAEVYWWAPAFLLPLVALYVIMSSMQVHDYAHFAYMVQDGTLNALSTGCFVLAALLALIPPLLKAVVRHLDRLSKAPLRQHLLMVGTAFAGFLIWLGFIRFCEYRAYLLPTDTSDQVGSAYMFIHHGALYYPQWGMNVLSQHFFTVLAVWAPTLLIWNSPLSILFMQHLLLCSVPFAAYGLIYLASESAFAGCLGLLLAMSTPYLYELLTANLDVVPLVAFFLWGMFFFRRRQWLISGLLFALTLTCKEQVPFIYFGLGLYLVYALRHRKPWNWVIGLGVCAAALIVWQGEMAVIRHFERLEPEMNAIGTSKWGLFEHLAPAGTPPSRILTEITGHPGRTLFNLFHSVYMFYPLLRLLFSMGFLCLLAPMEMIPFWTALLPHFMSNSGDPAPFLNYHPISYFDFGLHHSSYTLGPLIWATGLGICWAYRKLSPRGLQGWLLVWVLSFAGFGFKYAHRTLNPNWRASWFDAMPRVASLIPPHARIWADEYALAPLSTRRWVKTIQWGPTPPAGYKTLFKPDYVLFDKSFVVYGKPPYRDEMLTFFSKNHYKKIADDSNVVLLKSPDPSPDPESSMPENIHLPAPDPKLAQSYGQYLLQAPAEPN